MAKNPNEFQMSQTTLHLAMGRGLGVTSAMDHFMATGSVVSTSSLGLMQVGFNFYYCFILYSVILLFFKNNKLFNLP